MKGKLHAAGKSAVNRCRATHACLVNNSRGCEELQEEAWEFVVAWLISCLTQASTINIGEPQITKNKIDVKHFPTAIQHGHRWH